MEGAELRQDVARRAARDGADMHGRVGRIEASARVAAHDHLLGDAVELGDELGRGHDGVGPERRLRGMGLEAVHGREEGPDALVGVDHLEPGRLADDHGARGGQVPAEAGDRVHHAETGRLLVVGEQDVDRRLHIHRQEVGHERERERVEAFHVDGATAIGAPVLDPQRERIRGPGLPRDRHHVGVAREHDPAAIGRTDGGVDRGLIARRALIAHIGHAPALQIILDEVDQRQVRLRALGVEGDEPRQHLERRVARARHLNASRACRRGCRARRPGCRPGSSRRRRSPWCRCPPSCRRAW